MISFIYNQNPIVFQCDYCMTGEPDNRTSFCLICWEISPYENNNFPFGNDAIVVYSQALNDKFSADIETPHLNTFPDQYFTCTSKCLACKWVFFFHYFLNLVCLVLFTFSLATKHNLITFSYESKEAFYYSWLVCI